jgi:vacuole morphology and inheritance protein 14
MYNIAKVAKGEILLYFNQVFDALCKVVGPHYDDTPKLTDALKLTADSELSVKNGAELLDRLIKDIVAESAASYVSILRTPQDESGEGASDGHEHAHEEMAFSLERFLPLLEERINVLNPFTRTFLVAWITVLDSIPDLELVTQLPRFLAGLFKFLSDTNQDVRTATHSVLERFLSEIRKIARIKRGVAESRKSQGEDQAKRSTSSVRSGADDESDVNSAALDRRESLDEKDTGSVVSGSTAADDEKSGSGEDDWIPGQDIQIDSGKILDILVTFLKDPNGTRRLNCPTTSLTLNRRGANTACCFAMDRQFLRNMSRGYHAVCAKIIIGCPPSHVTRRGPRASSCEPSQHVPNGLYHVLIGGRSPSGHWCKRFLTATKLASGVGQRLDKC